MLQAAHSLARRYNPRVGMTRSWGAIDDTKSFKVIIDNLLNLELLLWAGLTAGNDTLTQMAISHATRTGELWRATQNSPQILKDVMTCLWGLTSFMK